MAIAAELQDRTVPGERAVLLFPPGLDFISAFFGCMYAGVIAVPATDSQPQPLDFGGRGHLSGRPAGTRAEHGRSRGAGEENVCQPVGTPEVPLDRRRPNCDPGEPR